MRETLEHSRDSSERGLRAYVVLTHPPDDTTYSGMNKPIGLPNYYLFFLKNTGQTPAYEVDVNCEWDFVEGSTAQWPEDKPFHIEQATFNRRGGSITLGGGEITNSRFELDIPRNGVEFKDALVRLRNGEVTIFIYGMLTYSIIYKDTLRRTTKFCFVLRHAIADGKSGVRISSYDRNTYAD